MLPTTPSTQECPLCGHKLPASGLEALGKHFEHCPKTDRVGPRGEQA